MKDYRMRVVLLAVFCGVMPIVGMDPQLTAADYLLSGIRDSVNLIARAQVRHQDLFDAAQNLPEEYDKTHLCIKTLEDAYFLFLGQDLAYKKRNNTFTTKPEVLASDGERAMEGARYFVQNLISQRKKDKKKYEEEKKEILVNEKTKHEAESDSAWQIRQQLVADLSAMQGAQKELQEVLDQKETQCKQQAQLLQRANDAVADWENKINQWKTFAIMSTGIFLGHFLYAQWK